MESVQRGLYPVIEKESLEAKGWMAGGRSWCLSGGICSVVPGSVGQIHWRCSWVDMPPPTPEQIQEAAQSKKAALKAKADSEIDWRQDAVDIGEATEKEAADLNLWKKYRVLLMRVETSNPLWPLTPDG